ncbi:30S ribosomal protein S4e [Candidatus Woesearchaeota archaeon]|nr:30S ribosomal protein S4e [Candidatus Woesearchaeota archaeon]
MAHLSRIAAPKIWQIPRKNRKWITRTKPGPYSLDSSINIDILLRYILKYGLTKRDIKKILNNKEIKIDNKIRQDQHFAIGLMDTISIEKLNKFYRLVLNKKGKFLLTEIAKEESYIKPVKVINKTILPKNRIQLNLSDGRNIIVNKDTYSVSDTLVLDLNNNKIINHLPLKEGATIYLMGGTKLGSIGKIISVNKGIGMQPAKITFSIDKETHETLKKFAYVIGVDKPIITLQNEK